MALAIIRVEGPERIVLPDVRRLDRMPSWPEWVASRVASMNEEYRVGRRNKVLTLPVNLTLSPAERDEIDRHLRDLDALCEQTPLASDKWEGETLIVITKMMLALPAARQNEVGAEASGEAFQAAVDDLPTWAVAGAVRRWYRGQCGENQRGEPYDYHWRPAPAELRRISMLEKHRVQQRADTLPKLLAAEPAIEISEEQRVRMQARVAEALRGIGGG